MKCFALVFMMAIWSSAAFSQTIGIFADTAGTDCNLIIPYPGASITAYAVATVDGTSGTCATGFAFRIAGLPAGWNGSVSAVGPGVVVIIGNPFAEGVMLGYATCAPATAVLLKGRR